MKRTLEVGGGALALTLVIAGCGTPEHTSAWYASHPQDMAVRLSVCERMAVPDTDCRNAENASLMVAKAPPTINPWGK